MDLSSEKDGLEVKDGGAGGAAEDTSEAEVDADGGADVGRNEA